MKRKLSNLFILLGIILIVLSLIIFLSYKLSDIKSGNELEDIIPKIEEIINKASDKENTTSLDMQSVKLKDNDYIGILSIPKINKVLPVMNNWSYSNLKISPCRYYGSIYTSDLVIAAHNYNSHFGRLNELEYGDEVIFTNVNGDVYTYIVNSIEILDKSDTDKMINNDYDLTLYTCNITGIKRITVRCLLKSIS